MAQSPAAKGGKALTKSELKARIAQETGLTARQVGDVLDSLTGIALDQLRKKAVQVFALPGLAKFRVVRKPATKARNGVHPFTKQPHVFAAKPARNVVRVRPLKAVKDAVAI